MTYIGVCHSKLIYLIVMQMIEISLYLLDKNRRNKIRKHLILGKFKICCLFYLIKIMMNRKLQIILMIYSIKFRKLLLVKLIILSNSQLNNKLINFVKKFSIHNNQIFNSLKTQKNKIKNQTILTFKKKQYKRLNNKQKVKKQKIKNNYKNKLKVQLNKNQIQ